MTTDRILVADDDKALVAVLSTRLRHLGFEVFEAYDAMSALNLAHRCSPDLLCIDINMPTGSGLAVCEMLRSDFESSLTPMIVLSGEKGPDIEKRCRDLSAYYVAKGGDSWEQIETIVCNEFGLDAAGETSHSQAKSEDLESHASSDSILDAIFEALSADAKFLEPVPETTPETATKVRNASSELWVLHVDDDKDLSDVMKRKLEVEGISVMRAFDGTTGVRKAMMHPASAIILDYEMPNGRGDYVLTRLRDNPLTRDVPIIVLTGKKDQFLARRLLNMGANAFFNKPPEFNKLVAEIRKLAGQYATA